MQHFIGGAAVVLALLVLVCGCGGTPGQPVIPGRKYEAHINYTAGSEHREVTYKSDDPAKVMAWIGLQSRENVDIFWVGVE